MFLVNAKEALGYTHAQTLDSSLALIDSLLQEYAYLCNERNRTMKGEGTEAEKEGQYITVIDFTTGKPKRIRRENKL